MRADRLDYREVGRNRVNDVELVRKMAEPYGQGEGWRWWSIVGPAGGVTFIEMPGMGGLPHSGDFGVHDARGADEDCYLIGRCRFQPNGVVGHHIAEAITERGAWGSEEQKAAVIWNMLEFLYLGRFE